MKPTLSQLRRSPSSGDGCFPIFVLETPEASCRVWVSVLLFAERAGKKSEP